MVSGDALDRPFSSIPRSQLGTHKEWRRHSASQQRQTSQRECFACANGYGIPHQHDIIATNSWARTAHRRRTIRTRRPFSDSTTVKAQ